MKTTFAPRPPTLPPSGPAPPPPPIGRGFAADLSRLEWLAHSIAENTQRHVAGVERALAEMTRYADAATARPEWVADQLVKGPNIRDRYGDGFRAEDREELLWRLFMLVCPRPAGQTFARPRPLELLHAVLKNRDRGGQRLSESRPDNEREAWLAVEKAWDDIVRVAGMYR